MELGCDGVLLNTGIAHAQDPLRMAHAMKYACDAGRLSPAPATKDPARPRGKGR